MTIDLTAEKMFLDSLAYDNAKIDPLYDFLFDAGLRAFGPRLNGEYILELGAGSCNFTQKLLAHGKKVDTAEGSTKICQRLEAKGLNNLIVIDTLFETFEPEKKYSDVVASFVNEHVADPSMIYRIARKALKSGGNLHLIVPNRDALSRQLAKEMRIIETLEGLTEADVKNGHRRTYDMESLIGEIESNGFKVEAIGGLLLKPFADFQLAGWLEKGDLDRTHLEGLEQLGKAYPRLCMALYAVISPSALH